MKYKTLRVPGHPRSGSHWINRVIDLNFFDGSDYLRHYGGHHWGDSQRAKQMLNVPEQAVIYMFRNVEDATNSIYRMRHRFGLDEDNYEKFKTTPMKQMYNPNVKVEAERFSINKTDEFTDVAKIFSTRIETVGQYLIAHVESWEPHSKRDNFMMVNYDDLTNNFDSTMLQIATFLESNKTEFVDEHERVGWREKTDNEWTKS